MIRRKLIFSIVFQLFFTCIQKKTPILKIAYIKDINNKDKISYDFVFYSQFISYFCSLTISCKYSLIMKTTLILISLFLSVTFASAQDHKLELRLHDVGKKQFDSLCFRGENASGKSIVIKGESIGENKGIFTFPEAVIDNVNSMGLKMQLEENMESGIIHDFIFHAVSGSDSLRYTDIIPDRKLDKITEIFDIRKEDNKDKLYSLCEKNRK